MIFVLFTVKFYCEDAVEDEKSSFENKPKNYAHLGEGEKDNRWVSAADGYHKRSVQ